MQTHSHRDRRAMQHSGDFGRRESFPIDQQQQLAIMRVESRERLAHPTDARVFVRLVRRGLSTQLLVQPAASGVRTGPVCEHPPRRRIEPRPRIIPGRHFAKAPPRDQKTSATASSASASERERQRQYEATPATCRWNRHRISGGFPRSSRPSHRSSKTRAARTLLRRQSQSVPPRNRAAKTAAASLSEETGIVLRLPGLPARL
jgi:hypothetical protein